MFTHRTTYHAAVRLLACLSLMGLLITATDRQAWAQSGQKHRADEPYVSIYSEPSPNGVAPSAGTPKIQRILAKRLSGLPGEETLKAWVLFRDKGIAKAGAYRSAIDDLGSKYNRRAVERRSLRRSRAGMFDEYDLPVVDGYIARVKETGARVRVVSKWLNGVSVEATKAQIEEIDRIPFVTRVQPVRRSRRVEPVADGMLNEHKSETPALTAGRSDPFYGEAEAQVSQLNLIGVHDYGFTGRHVIVGVLDSGFRHVHIAFNSTEEPLRIVAEWDFINDDPNTGYDTGDYPGQTSHGTWILGTMAAYHPYGMVGTAYGAWYILCKTEDTSAEYHAEEDYFVAGLEFIEANGGDVATASLGYLEFDTGYDYTQEDLDGLTAVTTIGVNIATGNGVHCVTSAGNEGNDTSPLTSHLGSPADAFDVITVGAVDLTGMIASFSSDGPTADGRVKPEVLTRGVSTSTVSTSSSTGYTTGNGTSFSAPLAAGVVACLVDAYPHWSVDKMRSALMSNAGYFTTHGTYDPEYVYGYGIIDALAALRDDCNENGIPDSTDISHGGSTDFNFNQIPDDCERNCNQNNMPDSFELKYGLASDCNGNYVPDECDEVGDFDGSGLISGADYALAADCLAGPCGSPPCDPPLYTDSCCAMADFDADGDFDLEDFGVYQVAVTE
ncbi:MAG: S8 family serine peptidase [Phycisphaerales bacterium]|nr:MAG: S8 family serine peptidase [Phycisphaerales bacterium]